MEFSRESNEVDHISQTRKYFIDEKNLQVSHCKSQSQNSSQESLTQSPGSKPGFSKLFLEGLCRPLPQDYTLQCEQKQL